MTKRLFVNGLPYHVTGEILENFFLAYGAVESVTVMLDNLADRSTVLLLWKCAASWRLKMQSKTWMALKWKDGP